MMFHFILQSLKQVLTTPGLGPELKASLLLPQLIQVSLVLGVHTFVPTANKFSCNINVVTVVILCVHFFLWVKLLSHCCNPLR